MTLGEIDHIAVVVRSIDESLPRYAALFGLRPAGPVHVAAEQRVRVCFLPTGPRPAASIELIEPMDSESGVARYLATRGEGLHHVCFRSSDLPADLAELAALEAELIDATPRHGPAGDVAFIHPRTLNGVLWELVGIDSRASIRPATAEDAGAIHRVRAAAWRATYAGLVPPAFLAEVTPDDPVAVRRLAERLGNPAERVRALLGVIGERVVGYAVVGPDRHPVAAGAAGTSRGEVYALYLLPEAQGAGLGRRLLREAERALLDAGFQDGVLWMIQSNERARGFYERMGWQRTGERKGHDLGADVPEIQFARRLASR